MKALDSLDLPVGRPTLLKLDVQGYELHVLRGGSRLIRDVALIDCELSVAELYEGQPPLLDVLNEIREYGFELLALEPGFYDPTTGAHLQFDGFFHRT